MSIYDNLNPEQLRAVKHTYGPLLILAGAGSGKTRVLTHRIAHLIKEGYARPYEILAITFTNKAAREMKERVAKTVGDESDNIWVSTFHSTCVRMLRRFCEYIGYDRNFTIYDADDQKSLIKSIMKELNIDSKQIKEKAFMTRISHAKDELITPEEFARNAVDYTDRKVADVYAEYQKRLKNCNAMDFDDLICKTIEMFVKEPRVLEYYRNRFRFILVDEYQDTNTAQFRLISMLSKHENEDGEIERNLCVVGDDDQSIYKFRGANIYNILNFEKEFPDTTVIKLEQNYRSSQNILAVANAVIHNNTERKDKTLWTANPEGSCVHYAKYETDLEEADAVSYRIKDLIELKGLEPRDFAVLYRTNAQSLSFEKAMRAKGVKAKTIGALSFFQRREIKDILAYLKTVDNAQDDLAVIRILNVPRRGIGLTTVDRIQDYAHDGGFSFFEALERTGQIPGAERARAKVEPFLALIQGFRYEVDNNNVSIKKLINIILEETEYLEYIEEDEPEKAEERRANIEALITYASRYEEEEGDEGSLTGFLEYCGLNSEEAAGEEPEDEEDKDNYVSLMTLHNAKGLEFPYVFLVGMEEGLFPSYMSINSDDPEADIEEERRLCYVGITRAKQELFMSSCEQRMQWGETKFALQSRFLKEIPRYLLDMSTPVKKNYRRPSFMDDEIRDKKPQAAYTKGNGDDGYKRHDGGDLSIEPFAMNYKKPVKDIGAGAGQLDYAEGDKVSHDKFGEGTVISIVKGGRDFEVTVDFPEFGRKKMLSAFAKLKKI